MSAAMFCSLAARWGVPTAYVKCCTFQVATTMLTSAVGAGLVPASSAAAAVAAMAAAITGADDGRGFELLLLGAAASFASACLFKLLAAFAGLGCLLPCLLRGSLGPGDGFGDSAAVVLAGGALEARFGGIPNTAQEMAHEMLHPVSLI